MRCSGSGPTQHAVEEGLKQKDGPGVPNKVPVTSSSVKIFEGLPKQNVITV